MITTQPARTQRKQGGLATIKPTSHHWRATGNMTTPVYPKPFTHWVGFRKIKSIFADIPFSTKIQITTSDYRTRALHRRDTAFFRIQQQAEKAALQPGQLAAHHWGGGNELTQIPLLGTAAPVTWCLALGASQAGGGVGDKGGAGER